MATVLPPARTEISDTFPNPSNAVARTGFGKLWDYVTNLLGTAGTPAGARTALELGTIATQASNNVAITGGAINGTPIGGTTRAAVAATTLDASTTGKVGTTLAVGGATPSASGAGITFPATQSASTDANTLDDYEEGTWTPTISGFTGSLSSATGRYTKIGNLVYVECTLVPTTTFSTTSGSSVVNGGPFSAANGSGCGGVGGTSFGNPYGNIYAVGTQIFLPTTSGVGTIVVSATFRV